MMTAEAPRAAILGRAELRRHRGADQIMGMPAINRRRWTSPDVRALLDESRHWPRYELLHGELLVTPAPRIVHQEAIARLHVVLHDYCEGERAGIALISPSDIELAPETIMQPDVFVIPLELAHLDTVEWPDVHRLLLAVEVLSPSSLHQDRVLKREFYLDHGVEEYWIVDLDGRLFERWTPLAPTPDVRRDVLTWHPAGAGTPFALDVAAFFSSLKLLRRG
ncbi:MAG TPA: Uma2 family endonuclease [Burkholderiales bacterium]|nr:Uma2 family endonuclease [Burkholderiales bacterium]